MYLMHLIYQWLHTEHKQDIKLFLESQVLLGRYDADGIGVTHTTTPALDTNHWITFGEDIELDSFCDTPLETIVNIFLPIGLVEVRFTLWEQERIDAAVKVRVLEGQFFFVG